MNETTQREAVKKLYDTYPFPPDPLIDEPPPGYNWRWKWLTAYNFCAGRKPTRSKIRILDAGCGTGVGTEYLVHLNPEAEVVAIDLSEGALAVAKERCRRSGTKGVEFQQLNLEDATQLPGEFELINCVGVLHHLPDPHKGIAAIARKLAPGGLLHIFVYAELGRWEITLMQEAIALLQGNKKGDYQDGVQVGREVFANLPENNRLVQREKERWAMENFKDECFADMYLHPQETDYRLENLFELIEASDLEFVGFSNPEYWDLERLLGKSPDLMARAEKLSAMERYQLIERLDPEITHYEFFLAKSPLEKVDWSDDSLLKSVIPQRNPCMNGWPSQNILNHNYQMAQLSAEEFEFLQGCDENKSVEDILSQVSLSLEGVRSLQKRQLVLLGI
ncbi:MAG: class I SAM-dependent methyltransferase [Spirulinaceae cyanobacterium]